MSKPNQDPLNDLLRRWSEQNAPTEAEIERLQCRISHSVRDARFLELPFVPREWSWQGLLARGYYFILGTATALVIMLGFMFLLRPGSRPSDPATTDNGRPQMLSPALEFAESQLAEKARLLAGMEEMFNGRLAWVAEHDQQVKLGLLPDAATYPRGSKPLAVRIVVLTRRNSDYAWKPVWQADAIAREDEVVDLAADSTCDQSLRLWMHALPDGAIAVDADLALDGTLPVRSSSSGVQAAGVPQRVFSSQSGDAEYQVYQIVAALPERSEKGKL